jgi:hypothetical protein
MTYPFTKHSVQGLHGRFRSMCRWELWEVCIEGFLHVSCLKNGCCICLVCQNWLLLYKIEPIILFPLEVYQPLKFYIMEWDLSVRVSKLIQASSKDISIRDQVLCHELMIPIAELKTGYWTLWLQSGQLWFSKAIVSCAVLLRLAM